MSGQVIDFKGELEKKDYAAALSAFLLLERAEQEAILESLYQRASCAKKPFLITVLNRRLHDEQQFSDFHKEWFPPKEACRPVEAGGQCYQQIFPVPVRTLNALNINDSQDVLSVGITWVSSPEEEAGLWAFVQKSMAGEDEVGNQRQEKVATVMDSGVVSVYRVETDDNFGTPF